MGEFRNISLVCIVSFQLYKAYPNGGIWKNNNWQQIYKQAISTFIHQTMCASKITCLEVIRT